MMLAIRERTFKGADIKRVCCKVLGREEIHSHSWTRWHGWADTILKRSRKSGKANKGNYWIDGEKAIVLLAIALVRKESPRKELDAREVKDRMPEASLMMMEYLKFLDADLVIGRDIREFLEIRGRRKSWTTIRNKIPDFSYCKAYRADLVLALVS